MARSTRDLAGLALGVGTLVGTTALARRSISRIEVQAFRTVNDLPGAGFPVIWLPMQYGTFGTVPVSAVLAYVRNRPRLALAIGVGGTTAWLSAKVLKRLIGRERPAGVIGDVQLRGVEEGDLGFPSGHAAVSAALTVVVLPSVTGDWRWSLAALSGFVPLARMYVGAHLPLDVVGGSALGMSIGSAVNLLIPTRPGGDEPDQEERGIGSS